MLTVLYGSLSNFTLLYYKHLEYKKLFCNAFIGQEQTILVWELLGGCLQKMMEKFSPTFFSQLLGVDFENLRYADQICMEHPYFGL